MKIATFIFAMLAASGTSLVYADALPINPGLWEVTSTSTNPMTGQEKTDVSKECIVDDKFDPVAMMGGQEGCQAAESQLKGKTLTFIVNCSMQGGTGKMTGVYEVDGDSGTGDMVMEVSFNGQTMTSKSRSKAKRLGDC